MLCAFEPKVKMSSLPIVRYQGLPKMTLSLQYMGKLVGWTSRTQIRCWHHGCSSVAVDLRPKLNNPVKEPISLEFRCC